MGARKLMLRTAAASSVFTTSSAATTILHTRIGGRSSVTKLGNVLCAITRKYSLSVAKESLLGIKQLKFSSVTNLLQIRRYK